MHFLLLRHVILLPRHALHVPVMPDSDRASQIAGQAGNDERQPAMTTAPGNDDVVPCTSFFAVMSSFFLVMPDPDRASLPLQIAGQAGNDDMVLCTSFFSAMPFLLRHARLRSNLS